MKKKMIVVAERQKGGGGVPQRTLCGCYLATRGQTLAFIVPTDFLHCVPLTLLTSFSIFICGCEPGYSLE